MHSRWHRRLATVFVAGLAAGCALLPAAGPAQADPPTADQIYATLGVDQVASDYVVLVDVSGSMQQLNLYGPVKDSLGRLFAALAPQDVVTLVIFADNATQVWQGQAGRSAGDIIAKLPPTANGAHTDIGLALEKAIDVLNRPNTPSIATVVLLTDGLHDPAPHSPYPLQQGYQWDVLTQKAAAIKRDSLTAYAIPLTGATSAQLLVKVFGSRAAVLPAATVDDLTSRLEQPKAAVRAAKARQILAPELAKGVSASWPAQAGHLVAGRQTVFVTLHSGTAHIPLEVGGFAVNGCDAKVRVQPPAHSVSVPPGGSVRVPLTVDWDAGPYDWKPRHTTSEQCSLRLTGEVTTPWSAFLANDLKETFAPKLAGSDNSVTFTAERGRPLPWLASGTALLVLFATLLVLRWMRMHPTLTGTLAATALSPDGRATSVPLRGRSLTISAANLGIAGSGSVRRRRDRLNAPTRLEIAYSRDGSDAAREVLSCPANGTVSTDRVRFDWSTGRAG
jgi:Mg-chelatase subunit ChlD